MTARLVGFGAAALLALLVGACSESPAPVVRTVTTSPVATPQPERMATPTATVSKALSGPPFVLLRSTEVAADARLNFMGQGFLPGELTVVTVESTDARVEATLEPVVIVEDGRFDEVSQPVPAGLSPGNHILRVVGTQSERSAQATFRVRFLAPSIKMAEYSAKARHGFSFSGSGFAPGEHVEVRLGGLGGSPMGIYPADQEGNVTGTNVPIPLVEAGDYRLYFVGQESQSPVSVGFNIQGFYPWAVLDTYAPPPYALMGFTGEDFIPDEIVSVYLNSLRSEPVAYAQADATGRFSVKNAFELPLLRGENQIIFVGQQSKAEVAVNFMAMNFLPGLELTAYAGRPGTRVAFIGSGWAREDTLQIFVGEKAGGQPLGTFMSDASGSFEGAGEIRVPMRTPAGGLPLTVRGQKSQSEMTLWFQVLDLKPTAELTAYQGPPGTVVSFTGRSFAPGEPVRVHLRDRGGPDLAVGVSDEEGTAENISSYPVDGEWGDVVPFVFVGELSGATAMTHFKFASP
jgi:hypothetical protein